MDATQQQPESDQSESDESFHLPAGVLDGQEYKAGDTITLKVVSVDADGGCEVEVDDGADNEAGEAKDWRTDLRDTMAGAKGDQ